MMRKLVAALLVLAVSAPVVLADVAPPRGFGVLGEPAEPWWGDQTGGWIGGIVGTALGVGGAVFGITAGLGRARGFLIRASFVLTGLGIVVLLVGIAALLSGQPYAVYYPPLIIGGITALVFGLNYPVLKRRNEQIELQKMSALDS